MKKNKPAVKGFSPFKENKSHSNKPGRPDVGGERSGRKPARPFERGERGEQGEKIERREKRENGDTAGTERDKKPTFRSKTPDTFRGNRSEDSRGNKSETFRGNRSEDSRDKKSDTFRGGKSEGFRDKKSDTFRGGKSEGFRDSKSERGERTTVQRSGAGKSFKDTPRETPSGFNRKKFFDNTNERFAEKQDRKQVARQQRSEHGTEEREVTPSKKTSRKQSSAEGNGAAGEMPLNKYLAHCGICSRRKAVDHIKAGKVTVNDQVVLEPAFKVTDKDNVKLVGKKIHIQKNLVYILLNKPKGYITTTDDPEGRQTVMELIADATEERVYPVGRLDRNTSGLLLLTNDGELAQKLAHPKHNIKKIYQVGLDKALTKADFEKIVNGVPLEDGVALVDALGYIDPKNKAEVGIEIHSGKNRIVRRIFEHLEYQVEKLDRVMYAGLTKKNVNRGKWRFLKEKEIILLKHFK